MISGEVISHYNIFLITDGFIDATILMKNPIRSGYLSGVILFKDIWIRFAGWKYILI